MRIVVQRVSRASVTVAGELVSEIGRGLMVLAGVEDGDDASDIDYVAKKLPALRVFEDDMGKMNLSVMDIKGEILIVSQFTLSGDTRHGNRPSFITAARPEQAESAFDSLTEKLRATGLGVKTGRFRTHMHVELVNDGPVTIMLDSRKGF